MEEPLVEKHTVLDRTRPSALVAEARNLGVGQRRVLEISDQQLALAEVVFRSIQVLLDDQDPRPLEDRFFDMDELAEALLAEFSAPASVSDRPAYTEDTDIELPRWLRRSGAPEFRRFARRFLGAAQVDRIASAAREDGAVVAVAARRALRYLLPIATAADRCIDVLPAAQLGSIEGLESLARSSVLEMAVQLDALINRLEEVGVPLAVGIARPSELTELPGPMGDLAASMQQRISEESSVLLEELSSMLIRKVRGARDALSYSSDPVSQAANSLIEFVDRLLRDAFDAPYVLGWIEQHLPARTEELTYERDGQLRPTKRGEALCFVYAGEAPGEHSIVHELVAAAVVSCRGSLQALKHADSCTEGEKVELLRHLHAIEAAMVLVLRVAWLGVEESRLQDLRLRLALAA